MNYLKKLSLAATALAFFLSLSVATGYAQPGRASVYGNNGKHKGWYKGKHNGWRNRKRQTVYYPRTGRYVYYPRTTRVYPRTNIYRTRNGYYYNDRYISNKQRRKMQKRYLKYRRSAIQNRRNW